jgi:16S rRNA G966 N2-methylase RsmD
MENEYRETLEFLAQSTLLKPTTSVIAEHVKKFDPIEEAGELRRYRKLKQGDAALSFYRKQ